MLAMLGLKTYIGDSKKSFSKTVISNVNRTGYLLCSSRKSTEHGYIRMIEVLIFQAMPNELSQESIRREFSVKHYVNLLLPKLPP